MIPLLGAKVHQSRVVHSPASAQAIPGLQLCCEALARRRSRRCAIAAKVEVCRYKAKPSRVHHFQDIEEALRVMESNEAIGKMVVVL
jgi:hypothetical protein